jgi:hypothetical protein
LTWSTVRIVKPKRSAFWRQAAWLLGWLSEKIRTSSPGSRSRPLETKLFDSLVLRVMTISSGVTRRYVASARRVASRPLRVFCRFCGDGSRSTDRVLSN